MARESPYQIELSVETRKTLEAIAGKYSSSYRNVVRAKVVLYAAPFLRPEILASSAGHPSCAASSETTLPRPSTAVSLPRGRDSSVTLGPLLPGAEPVLRNTCRGKNRLNRLLSETVIPEHDNSAVVDRRDPDPLRGLLDAHT